MIQIIRCSKCNKAYAGCRAPECYTERHWQTSVRRAAKQGDIIDMVDTDTFKLEACNCDKKQPQAQIDHNQLELEI